MPREGKSATKAVMPRLDRGIQYAAASRLNHGRLWNTGSPGPGFAKSFAGLFGVGPAKLQRRRQAGRRHRDYFPANSVGVRPVT
ncbi:hypothetical protein ABIF97_000695 [Bradyrhizobium japonicum]